MDFPMHLEDQASLKCPRCGKSFARKWTLNRHISEQHPSLLSEDEDENSEEETSEEETVDEEPTEESEPEDEESESEEEDLSDETQLSEQTINSLLHMIGAGELGMLQVTTESLQCFIKPIQDISDTELIVTTRCLVILKNLLLAAKADELVLTRVLYLDIINAIEKALIE